jgi:S1-C subfamily serine protease
MRRYLITTAGIIILVVLSLSLSACGQSTAASPTPALPTVNTLAPTPVLQTIQQPALPTITDVVAKVRPSVVAITDQVTTYDVFNLPTSLKIGQKIEITYSRGSAQNKVTVTLAESPKS